jgi:hypothetical protein
MVLFSMLTPSKSPFATPASSLLSALAAKPGAKSDFKKFLFGDVGPSNAVFQNPFETQPPFTRGDDSPGLTSARASLRN